MAGKRPEYIPEKMEFSAILRMRDRFRDNLNYERSILNTMIALEGREFELAETMQRSRVRAIEQMVEEIGQWAMIVRAHERMGPTFAGFTINQTVTVNGRRGRIANFKPTFEPTHIMVLFDGAAEPRACLPQEIKPL